MGLFDFLKATEFKETIKKLEDENERLKRESDLKLSVQQMKPVELQKEIDEREETVKRLNLSIDDLNATIENKENKAAELDKEINELSDQLIDVKDSIMFESYGLYKPKYDFANSSTYKKKLAEVRADQKNMIKDEAAAKIFRKMLLDNSAAKGRSMQKKNIKQLLRTFNGECEGAISKVTKSNFSSIEKRINRSFEQLNKLNEPNGVRLTTEYLYSKIDEARIALEYALKKEEERDILREQRQREQEERKLLRELANERKKYEKEETHYKQASALVEEKIKNTTNEDELASLKSELEHLKSQLADIQEKKEKLEDKADNPTAGYVYIISNIGAFGENVFKIGVTRRLDPMDRINELGSASVPFKFDVHALIFSENAYQLETELHNYFDKQRVNKVNRRKEYFNITIDEIKKVLQQHEELTFDFHEVPDANEYRDSLLLAKEQLQ